MANEKYVTKREEGDNRELFIKDKYITKIFRDIKNKDYVIFVLNTIFEKVDLSPIKDYELIDIKIAKKSNVVDSEADVVLEDGQILVNIEFNTSKSIGAQNKNLTYACWLILKQLPTGTTYEDYKNIKPIIQVNLNFYDQLGKGELMYVSKIMDIKYHQVTSNILTIINISLDILNKIDYNDIRKSEDPLLKVLYLWICNETEKLNELYKDDDMMARILGQLYDIRENGDEYLFYDREELKKQSLYEEARDEVYAEGREAGIAEGREAGREEKSIEIAKKLLKMNLSINDIQKATNLSKEMIEKLKKQI